MCAFLMEMLQELRHRPVSLFGCVQRLSNLPRGILGLTSNVLLFGMQNPADLRLARAELAGAARLTHEQLRGLPRGVACAISPQCNDPSFQEAQLIHLRPTLLRAGGETLTAF